MEIANPFSDPMPWPYVDAHAGVPTQKAKMSPIRIAVLLNIVPQASAFWFSRLSVRRAHEMSSGGSSSRFFMISGAAAPPD